MMKKRMPAQQPARPESKIKKTGEQAKKAGYPCVKYEVSREGQKKSELWVTDWDNVEGGEDVAEIFGEMAEFMSEMMESFASSSGTKGMGPGFDDAFFAHLKEMGGLPVITLEFQDGELEDESVLRSAKRQTIDPDAFEPPAGYKRQDMFRP